MASGQHNCHRPSSERRHHGGRLLAARYGCRVVGEPALRSDDANQWFRSSAPGYSIRCSWPVSWDSAPILCRRNRECWRRSWFSWHRVSGVQQDSRDDFRKWLTPHLFRAHTNLRCACWSAVDVAGPVVEAVLRQDARSRGTRVAHTKRRNFVLLTTHLRRPVAPAGPVSQPSQRDTDGHCRQHNGRPDSRQLSEQRECAARNPGQYSIRFR
jgi:hypothetical protein